MTTKTQTERVLVPKLAFSYRRFSSKNQTDNTSLQRQLEMAQAVCSEKGWSLIDLPPDASVSAYKITDLDGNKAANFHKGNLGAFLEKVRRGQIPKQSVLILERLDRFSRQYWDVVYPVWLELLQSGVEIYNCVAHTHYTLQSIRDNPMVAGMALMEMANANDYSKSLGQRITKGFSIKLADCQKGIKLSIGSWLPHWLDYVGNPKGGGEFIPNKHATTIQRIVSEYLSGKGIYTIARGLIADNVPTLKRGKWAQGHIAHILHSEALTGTLIIKGVKLERYLPAIITETQHDKLRAKLRENKNRKGGNGGSDTIANLFRNRAKCFHCKGTLSGDSGYYLCRARQLGSCSSKHSVRLKDIEMDFFLHYLQQSPKELLLTQNTPEHTEKVASIQTSIGHLDNEIAKIMELTASLPITELRTKLTTLENKRQTAKSELDKLNNSIITSQNVPKAFLDIKALFKSLTTHPVIKLTKGSSGHLEGPDIDQVWAEHWETVDRATQGLTLAETIITDTLKDNDTRKRLLGLLPSIVKGLVIDTTNKQYAVVNHNGQQSDWRKV
jgi:DNA invertase Pin-like site-specific DNA recombinase